MFNTVSTSDYHAAAWRTNNHDYHYKARGTKYFYQKMYKRKRSNNSTTLYMLIIKEDNNIFYFLPKCQKHFQLSSQKNKTKWNNKKKFVFASVIWLNYCIYHPKKPNFHLYFIINRIKVIRLITIFFKKKSSTSTMHSFFFAEESVSYNFVQLHSKVLL